MIPLILWTAAALALAVAVGSWLGRRGATSASPDAEADAASREALELLRTANAERRAMTPSEWTRYTNAMDRVRTGWAERGDRG